MWYSQDHSWLDSDVPRIAVKFRVLRAKPAQVSLVQRNLWSWLNLCCLSSIFWVLMTPKSPMLRERLGNGRRTFEFFIRKPGGRGSGMQMS